MLQTIRVRVKTMLLMVLLSITGCRPADDRLVDVSEKSLDRQTEQNRLVSRNNEQIMEATKRLVEADAQSRREHVELQRQIQSAEGEVRAQRDALEQERRQIALLRHRDQLIAESIQAATAVFTAVLPLVLCALLLWKISPQTDDSGTLGLVIEELLTREALLENVSLNSANDSNGQGSARIGTPGTVCE